MTFIEIHINEDESELAKLIGDDYMATYREALPRVRFGRAIVWRGRMFQELQLPKGADSFSHEDRIFCARNLPDHRARMQIGSILGEVFTTPPEAGNELAARIKEGGRCGKEYVVRPFHYSDFLPEV